MKNLTKTQQVTLTAMQSGKLDNQAQQNHIFKALNGADSDFRTAVKDVFQDVEFECLELSDEQSLKGFDWLKNLWVTPTGAERKNNPFGYREQHALENFERIVLVGYYDAGRHRSYYIPLYDVYAKDGYGFQYYVNGGEISIIG